MATTTNPAPVTPATAQNAHAQDEIQLTATRLSVVTVRGITYQFTVTGSISDKRCDELVKNHIEFLLTASGKNSFDSIKSVIKPNAAAATTQDRFTVESSQVKYQSKKGRVKEKDVIEKYVKPLRSNQTSCSPETRQKISSFWEATQQSLIELTSGAPSPAQPTPQAPQNASPHSPAQLLDAPAAQPAAPVPAAPAAANPAPAAIQQNVQRPRSIITPYVNRAKKMPNPVGGPAENKVDLALAKQLAALPNVKFHGKRPLEIANTLRNEYLGYINEQKEDYIAGTKFTEIFENLQKAHRSDNATLMAACDRVFSATLGSSLGYTNINGNQLNALMSNTTPQGITRQNKLDLIKIHDAYVKSGGFLNENSFLEAFVKIHDPVSNPDKFEVIVVNSNNTENLGSYLCDDNPSRPTTKLPVTENNCAFLCVDDQSRYQSIPRQSRDFRPIGRPIAASPTNDVSADLERLVDLYDNQDTYNNLSLKTYIEGSFAQNYPQAYNRIKRFIYEHDRINNVNRNIINGFNNQNYGQLALNAITPDDLANLLMNNKEQVLAVGRDENALRDGQPVA